MFPKTPKVSILALLLLVSFVAVGLSWWKQRDLARRHASLQDHTRAIEHDYVVRARVMLMLHQLDTESDDDRNALEVARRFFLYLSTLDKIGEKSNPISSDLSKNAEIADIDGDDGDMEILLLTSVAKFSPGFDRSLVVLFDGSTLLDVLPVETGTRTWHEVTLADFNRDGVDDVKIEEYIPGNPTTKTVTAEIFYNVTKGGFELAPGG